MIIRAVDWLFFVLFVSFRQSMGPYTHFISCACFQSHHFVKPIYFPTGGMTFTSRFYSYQHVIYLSVSFIRVTDFTWRFSHLHKPHFDCLNYVRVISFGRQSPFALPICAHWSLLLVLWPNHLNRVPVTQDPTTRSETLEASLYHSQLYLFRLFSLAVHFITCGVEQLFI